MSTPFYDAHDEPKKYFVNNLIWMLTELDKIIYFRKESNLRILEPLQGIIDFLPKNDKDQLQDVNDEIERYLVNVNLLKNRKQIKKLYRKISDYLHETHLKEIGAKPKFKRKGHLTVPSKKSP